MSTLHSPGPALRLDHVSRRRLFTQLSVWRSLRLVLITAPAGFGKSTFVAEWISQLTTEDADETRPLCAWLDLGSVDSTPELLLHDLVEALSVHTPDITDLLASLETGAPAHTQFVRSLARRLGRSKRHIVLVLDDFHLLGSAASSLIQDLLDHTPPTLHLVVLSRTMPALRTARLHLNSAVLTIDADALRFDHDEFDAFAQRSALARLSVEQRCEIERRADGWIAGLHMLAQAKRTLLDEYTASEVLQHLPNDLRRFLTDVAPLPYLTPELCAAAVERSAAECEDLITAAESSIAFVIRLAHSSSTDRHRIHPLLQEVLLRERTRRTDCTPEDDLRRRGAEHLAALGDVDAALHLLPTDDESTAECIVTRVLRPALLRYELRTARRWLSRLTPTSIAGNAQLAVDAAWLEYFAETPDFYTAADRAQSAVCAATCDELRAEAAVLAALSHFIRGAHEDARTAMDAVTRLPHRPDGLAAGYIQIFDGYVPHDPADVQTRIHHIQRAADIFQRAGHPHGIIEAAVTQGYVKMRYANAAGAIASLQHAFGVMKIVGREHSVFSADAARGCADLMYRMDRIQEALAMIERARLSLELCDAGPEARHLDYMLHLLTQQCQIAADKNTAWPDEAEDAHLWADVRVHSDVGDYCAAAILRIQRDQQLGLIERCWQTSESLAVRPAELRDDMGDVMWYAVLAGCVHSGRVTAAVEKQIERFRERMEDAHNLWMRLRVDVLLTLCAVADDRQAEALERITRLLPEIESSGMSRLILDYAALQPLVSRCPLPYAQRLCAHPSWKNPTSLAHPFGLSPQEMRILQPLIAGKTTDAIALELFLSVFTVRAHLRSIYKKLGVHSRAEAVRVAQAAGMGERGRESE